MHPAAQRKIVDVDRGLFLVRYSIADDEAAPPVIRLSADSGSRDAIRFVVHPDEREPILRQPGACLVMRADAQGRLTVDIAPLRQNGSVAARIKIEPLQIEAVASRREANARHEPVALGKPRLLGHVANRGDVGVDAETWLAGPAAPSRIEGFQIDWPDKPDDLDLRYAVKTARPHQGANPMAGLGTFVGSRGRSLAIVGLAVELAGPAAHNYQISAEMIFLGSPLQRSVGRRIEGSGPTGREPLVGFRFSVEAQERAAEPLSVATLIQAPRPAERVRIFRSALSDKSATP